MINYFTEDVDFHLVNKTAFTKWLRMIVKLHGKTNGDINYIFCSDAYLLKINKEYLNHDYFTDIITFNYNDKSKIAGDIFISIDTVTGNAKEYNVSLKTELKRVMVHGILHLIGFDDKTEDQKIVMRQKEDEALNIF